MTSSPSTKYDHAMNGTEQEVLTSPFITTSDVMNQLNMHLAKLSSADDDDAAVAPMRPRFELQKRLPDGSAIPASAEEIAANDFKTKLEQCATFVSRLATPDDRTHWAETQRRLGNVLFGRGDYRGAMDVYLTCLVVKENTPDFVHGTLLPVLNNLAQCTTQLGMHKKTVVFCDMALEAAAAASSRTVQGPEFPNDDAKDAREAAVNDSFNQDATNDRAAVDPIALCKIHFKKAKALRLTGEYVPARAALDASLDQLEKKERELASQSGVTTTTEARMNALSLEPYQQALQKEYRHLDTAEREARRNRQRQKRAMQKVLSSSGSTKATKASNDAASDVRNRDDASSPLYGDLSTQATPRQYSTLRARKNIGKDVASPRYLRDGQQQNAPRKELRVSYSRYYWDMVARVTTLLLRLLGDDESDQDQKSSEQ
jgi:hypothetical protein